MKQALDSATVEIPCPHCTNKTSKTIAQLKTQREYACRHCGNTVSLDTTQMRRELAQVEQQLENLSRTLRRLGK